MGAPCIYALPVHGICLVMLNLHESGNADSGIYYREGLTSLDLAVLNGNVATLTLLLEDHQSRTVGAGTDTQHLSKGQMLPGSLLMKALSLESLATLQRLNRSVFDVRHRDLNGRTVLHLAVRSGKIEYVEEILHKRNINQGLDLDARVGSFGALFTLA